LESRIRLFKAECIFVGFAELAAAASNAGAWVLSPLLPSPHRTISPPKSSDAEVDAIIRQRLNALLG
jgi:hypothetical protein